MKPHCIELQLLALRRRSFSDATQLVASLAFRRGRAYVKALTEQPLSDDDFDIIAPATGVFVDDRELRPGVEYLVSPGAKLRFGEASDAQDMFQIEFEEPTASNTAGLDMIMKAMAKSNEVREKLQ